MPAPTHSDADIIASLQYVATELGHSPRSQEYRGYFLDTAHPAVKVSPSTVSRRFTTWNLALEAAKLDPIPAVDLLNMAKCLVAAAAEIGRAPNTAEYDRLFARKIKGIFISRQTIIQEFGNWRAALRFAGLEVSSVCRKSRTPRPGSRPVVRKSRRKPQVIITELGPPKFRDERLLHALLRLAGIEELLSGLTDDDKLDDSDPRVAEVLDSLFKTKRLIVESAGSAQ